MQHFSKLFQSVFCIEQFDFVCQIDRYEAISVTIIGFTPTFIKK